MNFSKYVEEEKIKARKNNIIEVRQDIKKTWVQKKIKNYLLNNPGLFTKEEVEENILNNDLVASLFCKDPSEQNISEKLCAKVLKLTKLPSYGKKSIRFNSEGNITSIALGNTKSADFFIDGAYATQKYTVFSGGAHDNQRNDVIDFLKRGSIKHRVMAILDGDYWDENRKYLIDLFHNNPNITITSVTELTGGIND